MRREKGTLWEDRLLWAPRWDCSAEGRQPESCWGQPEPGPQQFPRAASGEHGAQLPCSLPSGEEGQASSRAAGLCRMALNKAGPKEGKAHEPFGCPGAFCHTAWPLLQRGARAAPRGGRRSPRQTLEDFTGRWQGCRWDLGSSPWTEGTCRSDPGTCTLSLSAGCL